MEALVAFGTPNWPSTGRPEYDWWPLVFPIAAVLLAVWPLRMALNLRRLAIVVIGGTVAAWTVNVVGLLPAIAGGVLALTVGAALLGRRPRPERDPG
jgi:hypothetical protein